MLLGAVPYLNSIPLIRGLNADLRQAPPAVLERLVRIGEVDVATAPVTALFHNPTWRALPGVGIGTKGAARSVLLCTRNPDITFENVRSIYLDMESRTSAHLVQVLLAKKYGRRLDDIEFITPLPSPGVEAKMIIGDKALKELNQPAWDGNIYDLGKEWTDWTQLPFVFACWVTRHSCLDASLVAALRQNPTKNLAEIDNWIGELKSFDRTLLTEYFTQNMDYRFEAAEQAGLTMFYRYLEEIDLVPSGFKLQLASM